MLNSKLKHSKAVSCPIYPCQRHFYILSIQRSTIHVSFAYYHMAAALQYFPLCLPFLCMVAASPPVAVLTLLVPPDFGGASKKCQGEF
jgi:hypothetical protein